MVRGVLVFLVLLAAGVWVGGLVAIAVVSRIVRAQLEPPDQVVFFRTLGRSYGKVGTAALGLALGCGAALLLQRPADALLVATVVTAALLVGTTGVGIRQARAMTRLRVRGLADPDLNTRIRHRARMAALCRSGIAALTLALLALAAAQSA